MAILCPGCGREYDATLFGFGAAIRCDCGSEVAPFPDLLSEIDPAESVEMPIDGTLDLHTFAPAEVKDLVPDYLEACREKGILRVRVVHGKGDGSMLRTVHAILGRTPGVESFELADSCEGGWGATIVHLKP
jgi:dsDNA-specific endonuclease/ATPase MutS2